MIRMHSLYLRTRADRFWNVGCRGLGVFDSNGSVRMKRTDRNRKFGPAEYRS